MYMPNFFKDMPTPKKGKFKACVSKNHSIGIDKEIWRSKKIYNCRKKAYLKARIMALFLSWFIDSEWGIEWAIIYVKEN